jgi:hypothetical protein
VIDEQTHLELRAGQPRDGQALEAFPQRGARDRDGIDDVGLAELARRTARVGSELGRDAHDGFAAHEQESLKRAGDVPAVLDRPHPQQPGFHKRRAKLTETIEWLIGVFAEQSPGYRDDLVLIDSTPVECARSVETVRRSALSDAAGYGYCRSHSRWFYGFRLHLVAAPGLSDVLCEVGVTDSA